MKVALRRQGSYRSDKTVVVDGKVTSLEVRACHEGEAQWWELFDGMRWLADYRLLTHAREGIVNYLEGRLP